MKVFKAYTSGLKEALSLPKPVLLIYFINLLIAALIAVPLFGIIDKELGNSFATSYLLEDFNFRTLSELRANLSDHISTIISQTKWMILIYWLLSIFLAGGIIRTLNQDKFSMTSFFSGSGYNFFRFFRISVVINIIQIIAFLLIFVPAFLIIYSVSDSVASERPLFNIFFGASVIWFLVFILILMASDYSKFYAVLYDKGHSIKSVLKGFKYVFKNFRKTYTLYFLLIILPALVLYGYFKADAEIGTHTAAGVIIMFIIQQLFIILRIWFRVWIYSSPLKLYTDDFLKEEDVQQKIAIINEWNQKAKEQINKPLDVLQDINENNEKEEKTLTEIEILEKILKEEENKKKLEKEIEKVDEQAEESKEKTKQEKTADNEKAEEQIKKNKNIAKEALKNAIKNAQEKI